MADSHQVIVHHVGEMVGGQTVGLDQHGHVHLGPLNADFAAQQILKPAFAFARHAQTDDVRFAVFDAPGGFFRGNAKAMAVVARLLFQAHLFAAHFRQAFFVAETGECEGFFQQDADVGGIDFGSFALPVRAIAAIAAGAFVPVEAKPAQGVQYFVFGPLA